ncbi:MAG: PDZ domain-containing protein, partial [Phycisphaerales bacterium]
MKVRNASVVFLTALFVVSTALYAEPEAEDKRPYIGVLLDEGPLPDLLLKHLRLSPGQGIRIGNVHRGGPADEAGLERDDIIIGLQGEDVTDLEEFIENV